MRVGGTLTLRAVEFGQLVLVRAEVAAARAHSAIVKIPTVKLPGPLPVEVPICELFLPQATDAACEVAALLVARIDALHDIGLRLQAELYELGGHALQSSGKRP